MVIKRSLSTIGLYAFLGFTSAYAQNTLGYTQPEAHFRNGLEYFEKSNFVASREEFAAYLKSRDNLLTTSDYNVVTAEYYIAVTGLYLNYPEAEVQVERFVRNHAEHPKAQLIFSDLGQYFFELGDYEKSISYLEKAVRGPGGTNSNTIYQLGIAYYKTQAYDQALPLFSQVKMDQSFTYAADASYFSGVINYQQGKYREAYEDFRRIENSEHYKNEAPNWLVSSLYQLKNYDELLTYGERILTQQRNNPSLKEVALYVAEVYYEQKQYDKAVVAYERYSNFNQGGMPATVMLHYGHSLFRQQNFAEAAEQLRGVAAAKDSVGQYAAYLSGISYLNIEQPANALPAFANAASLDFNKTISEEAAFNHAKLSLETGSAQEAVKEFNEFIAKYPDSQYNTEANQLIASAYSKVNNNTAAIKHIEGLKTRNEEINRTYQRLTYNQALSDYNQGSFQAAMTNVDKALKFPVDEEIWMASNFLKAETYIGLKNDNAAISLFEQTAKNPKAGVYAARSLYNLGYFYYNQKNYSKALTYFREFTNKTEGVNGSMIEDAFVRLADCYLAQKNYREALNTYDRIVAQGKAEKDYALFQKGRAYVYMNNEIEAKRQFETLMNQYPDSRYIDDAMFQLADLDFQAGSYQLAVRSFTRLINEHGQSYMVPAALLRRGQAYYNTSSYENAITDFKRILADYPKSPSSSSALEGLQESYNAVGRTEEFGQVLSSVRKNIPGNAKLEDVEFDNARNLYFAGKYDSAISTFLNFIDTYPSSNKVPEIKYFLGASYDKSDNFQQALQYYGMVIKEAKTTYVSAAAQRAAEIEIQRGNTKNGITHLRTVVKQTDSQQERVAALTTLMDTYYSVNRYDSTLYFAREMEDFKEISPEGYNKARLYPGKIAYVQGNNAKALTEFNAVASSLKNDAGAEAKYMVSEIQFKEKKYKEAEATIFELSKEFEGSDYWRVRSFILLSDVYLAQNQKEQAKATLQSIIDNSDDTEAVDVAKIKISQIN